MPRIDNPHYNEFLKKGIIKTLNEEDLNNALENVKGRYRQEGRALLIALYYTGARPNEILKLTSKDFKIENTYLIIQVPGSKGGLPRPIYLKRKHKPVKELENYALNLPPDMLCFYHYKSHYLRKYRTKSGDVRTYIQTDRKIRYHTKKWFNGVIGEGIPPYYLRHNRFSKLAEAGLDMTEIRMLKGSKTLDSVTPYLHMSTKTAKKIAKRIE